MAEEPIGRRVGPQTTLGVALNHALAFVGAYLCDRNMSRSAVAPIQNENEGIGDKIQSKMDAFREFVATSCCSCAGNLPSAAVVAIAALLLILLLALIPTIFLIADFASTAEKFSSSNLDLTKMAMRPSKSWPKVDKVPLPKDGFEDIHTISMDSLFPPNVSSCVGFGFSCTSSVHIVIPTSKRCDGVPDCPDGSDEENCRTCQTLFSCSTRLLESGDNKEKDAHHGNVVCLAANKLCDGVEHCIDGSDENKNGLCKETCEKDEHQCVGRKLCLPNSAVCNGILDCDDGSDEANCKSCHSGSLKCGDECVPASQICDGVAQCVDGSDEKNCDCKTCSGSKTVLCDDKTCIDRSAVCDGHDDCAQGMDERDCPGSCTTSNMRKDSDSTMVTCADGRQYLESEACSGEFDTCKRNCPNCDSKNTFKCPQEDLCLSKIKVCDGFDDCRNGEDEVGCSCNEIDAKDEAPFKCATQDKCIQATQVCDGVRDCFDWSDEQNCEQCPADSIRCPATRKCLPRLLRCNGVVDCEDGSDEEDCSCDECTVEHSNTYMCDSGTRCLRREDVCAPFSLCPNATRVDKAYCAVLSLSKNNKLPW
ncbi:unnamed protein product [Caenorhabditis auriculariae]|uniref:Uncharacterized protein n=1 Tax=Caenorhabditis auriculariae TaxID=2777116 RepID=A0A8S1GPA6_9PELO|nr:unnamed protein product [Caenorhabditis auriculariae]